EDFMKPDRVVVGVEAGDERAERVMRELYGPFTRTGAPIMFTDTARAELCKYAANSILATKISFMNEIANMCELVGPNLGAARRLFGDRITLCDKAYDALEDADALVLLTEWNTFREPDFEKMRARLRSPVVFDGRNVYSPEQMRALGFTYFSIGR